MCGELFKSDVISEKTYKFYHRDMYSAIEERLAYNEEWDETAELTTVRLREGMVLFLGHCLYFNMIIATIIFFYIFIYFLNLLNLVKTSVIHRNLFYAAQSIPLISLYIDNF